MYTKQALREIGLDGVRAFPTRSARRSTSRAISWSRALYSKAECREMGEAFDQLSAVEGEQGGHEVHVEPGAPRVSNIFNKIAAFDRCLEIKPVLAACRAISWARSRCMAPICASR